MRTLSFIAARAISLCLAALFHTSLSGQSVLGKVTDRSGASLPGASVYWCGTTQGAQAGLRGEFQLATHGIDDLRLVASYTGYRPDTLAVDGRSFYVFALEPDASLSEVVVQSTREGVILSNLQAIKTEQITREELTKAACCDLAGCFETQTTVQPQTTNVVTNARELRILGLSGVYNQILIDGLPMIQGLTYTYGVSSIPGTLVENIFVSKGANSVLQGFESMVGQINVETRDPLTADKLFLNAYANNFGERHFNANFAFGSKKWRNLSSVHVVQPAGKIDRDFDGFLDLPRLTRYMMHNQWAYGKSSDWGWHSRIGLRYLREERVGGQRSFDPDLHAGTTEVYGQAVSIEQPEVWTKTGYRLNDRHHFVLLASAFQQEQDSYFGTLRYQARQRNAYANAQHEFSYGDAHMLKSGVSLRMLELDEVITIGPDNLDRGFAGRYLRSEAIAGAFVENTLVAMGGRLTWLAGLRSDHHDAFGWRLTPRTLLKYDLSERTSIRASAGTGWRTVNVFSENIGLLASSRDVVFQNIPRPEQSVNTGVNATHHFESEHMSGYLSADFYHTRFQNQVFPDYDRDPGRAYIYNFGGRSVSNGFQAEAYVRLYQRYAFKAGYNFLDVYRMIDGQRELLPFNPRHKVLGTFSYKPPSDRFHFDMNVHWYGPQRLPSTEGNPVAFQRPDFSQTFTLVNAQLTYKLDAFEIYVGCENLFDFRQLQPILGWQDPFGPHFDTAFVWGPTRGREFYAGLRYRIPA